MTATFIKKTATSKEHRTNISTKEEKLKMFMDVMQF